MKKKIILKIILITTITLIILFISFLLVTCKVTFETNGGSKISNKLIVRGTTLKDLSIPEKLGYTFEYWLCDGKRFDKNKKITKSITLNAVWKKNTSLDEIDENYYKVSFDTDGGTSIEDIYVMPNESISKVDIPLKKGYKFKEWTLNGKTYDLNSNVTKSITLKAIYTVSKDKNYVIKVGLVDNYSPERVLTVYEDDEIIKVKAIKYTDGYLLCNGNNTTVSMSDINGETKFIIILNDGTEKVASVE